MNFSNLSEALSLNVRDEITNTTCRNRRSSVSTWESGAASLVASSLNCTEERSNGAGNQDSMSDIAEIMKRDASNSAAQIVIDDAAWAEFKAQLGKSRHVTNAAVQELMRSKCKPQQEEKKTHHASDNKNDSKGIGAFFPNSLGSEAIPNRRASSISTALSESSRRRASSISTALSESSRRRASSISTSSSKEMCNPSHIAKYVSRSIRTLSIGSQPNDIEPKDTTCCRRSSLPTQVSLPRSFLSALNSSALFLEGSSQSILENDQNDNEHMYHHHEELKELREVKVKDEIKKRNSDDNGLICNFPESEDESFSSDHSPTVIGPCAA